MASTLVQMYAHVIFHVKSTGVNMRESDLKRICEYIAGVIKNQHGIPIAIGGVSDHIHILCSMPKTMSISELVRTIKIASNSWMKKLLENYDKFAWQDGYGAFSVSPSILDKTKEYVLNQAEHHKKISFEDEYRKLLKAYEIEYDERYAFS